MRQHSRLSFRLLTLLPCLILCAALAASEFAPASASPAARQRAIAEDTHDDPSILSRHALPPGAAGAPSFLRVTSPLRALISGGSPYTGTPQSIPGVIQAEDFDHGGEGISYHDTTPANEGNFYRLGGVDITSTSVGPNVGWTQVGEWIEYTVNVAATSTYKLEVIAAAPGSTGAVHIEIDGADVTGNMPIPNTGAWGTYGAAAKSGVLLTAGTHVMRVSIDGYGFLFDRVQVSNEQTPYGGTPWPVPGSIQAEDFDNGGEGVAYHDTTTANEGNFYRTTGVDITSTAAGPNVGWTQVGEWLEYTVNVTAAGTYTFQAIAAAPSSTGAVHFEIDGVDVTGNMPIPNTGAWGTYGAATKTGVQLTAGTHVLKVGIDGYGFLLNSINIVPPVPSAPSGMTAAAGLSTTQISLGWQDNSSNETGFKIERKAGAAGTYAEVATVGAGVTGYTNTGLASNTQYFYRVRATNLGGDSAYSNEASATTGNQPPTVSLTAPANGTSYTAPASVTLTATAADADGGVTKVEFYQGATKIGEDTTSPYSYTWSNVPAGSYSLTARAIDTNGAAAPSAAAAVTVALPTVTISATDAAASEQGPDTGTFTVSRTGATDAALTVNYTVGGTATAATDYASVGTSVTIPAGASSQAVIITPVDDAVVENGGETVTLTLAANAAYTLGTPSSATVNIADNDSTPPTVSVTAPSNGAVFDAYTSINITANASDPDPGGSVTKVEFFQGATKIGEDTAAPFAFTWANVPPGSYSLTAKATDNAGVATTSAAVNVTVSLPTVTVTATDASASEQGPDTGTFTVSRTGGTVSALTVNYALTGTAANGTDYSTLSGSVTIPVGASSQAVTVTPVDDAIVESGGETVTLTLSNNAAYTLGTPSGATVNIGDNDNTPPTVSVTAPSNGAVFDAYASINITANASDPDPGGSIAKVEFFQNGVKIAEDTTPTYSYSWENVPPGSYSLTAKATDNAGAITTSSAVNVTVSKPTVTVTATDASASEQGPDTGTFTVSRTGGTVSALTVNYTVGGTATSGSDFVALSGSVTIPAGASSQAVTVTPVDDAAVEADETVSLTLASGAAYTTGAPSSASVTIASNDFNPPTVSLTSPTFNAVFNWPASVTLTADASTTNPNGSISKVEFFQNNVKLGEDTTAPYSFVWNDAPAAFYQLKARATDNRGLTTTSNVVNITVYAPPSVSIQSPATLSAFTAPASITVSANVTDPMGELAWVTFSANGVQIGQDSTAPYSVAWNDVPAGTYHLVATAVDGGGSTFDSSVVTVTVGSAPAVEVRSPEAGAVFIAPASINIEADTFSSIGIGKVEFFQNNVKLGEDTSAPYSFAWANVATGTYSLTAKATDLNGAATTSYPIDITVNDNAPPTAQLTSPAVNAAFGQGSQITLAADAADADGSVTKVEFFDGGTKLGEDTTAPYSFVWTGAPAGSHSLTAVATDDRGATGTSAAVAINVAAFDFQGARLDPSNRTGAEGVDLYSGNFNWSLPLVSLPGRAGLDLGLSLTYNSLVWTKSGAHVLFDGDGGWPSPGFRLGFPVVQGEFYDTQAQKAAYMLVTPSGGRVSLRYVGQTATTTTYEAGDSSYLQLTKDEADGSLTLVSPGGRRMRYEFVGGVYKCKEVRDRNGNFITVGYNDSGNIQTVTDTLGRVINFDYYADGYLEKITQTWNREVEGASTATEVHRWAKFEYFDPEVRTNFEELTVLGPTGGQTFHALRKVTLGDDSSFVFDYTSWGQVYKIEGHAKDNSLLNRVTLGLPLDQTQPQRDCPRLTGRRDWAAYSNGDTNGVPAQAEELVTAYDVTDGATWTNPEDNQPQTGRLVKMTSPDGTVYKEYAHSAGWDKGLARLAEVWSGTKKKKWTSTTWTQDDENLTYKRNPRVRETNVYDSNEDGSQHSRRRTTVSYIFWGLPEDVREYDSDGTTVLRRTHTEYLATSVDGDGAYALRRIIGLPEKREVYGREGEQEKLFSKVTYEYDQEPGCLTGAGAVAQHKAEYDASFKQRGNLCVARRWDVDNPTQSVASRTGYDTAGSVVFTRDADGHEAKIEYAPGAGALAYPTKMTDPEGFFSTLEYNYDTGALTRAVDRKGAAVKTYYDTAGRRLKVKSEADGASTKWEYGENGLFVKYWTKIDTGKPETFILSVADGTGNVVGVLREHPGGVTGYVANRTEYDPVNRVLKEYKAAEVQVDANKLFDALAWVPAGEDATPGGWPHATTEYDWKGRPKRIVNSGGKDKLFEYDGCGCAGGEVVTAKDEEVSIPGFSELKRRAQRVRYDILGRPWKSEMLDWDGAVYSTTTTMYDALNRTVRVRQYTGVAPSDEPTGEDAGYRTTTMTYDGHGRLKERHAPQQETGRNTVYEYNDDDTLKSVTDTRGVKTEYGYDNDRHLVSSINFNSSNVLPGQNVQPTAGVSFTYDAAGNREKMTDGFGFVEYTYDTLSRLRSEKRTFHDPDNAAVEGVVRELKYDYNLAGQLKSVEDPFETKVDYNYDKAGQLTSVTPDTPYQTGGVNGVPATQVTEYLSGMQYRAWGALKGMSYGNGLGLSMTYTAERRPDEFKVSGATTLMWSKYQHYDDGTLKSVEDELDHRFDRSYRYDNAGRLEEAFSGAQALSFVKPEPSSSVPYWQKYEYDVWGNTKKRENHYWSRSDIMTADYDSRNRRYGQSGPLDALDAEGNLVNKGGDLLLNYDAAGRNRQVTDNSTSWVGQWHDGAGQVFKRREERHDANGQISSLDVTYYMRSTVLGGAVVSELTSAGGKVKSLVYAGRQVVAELLPNWVTWRHEDPVTGTRGESNRDGAFGDTGVRFDPGGVDIGSYDPYLIQDVQPVRDEPGGAWLLGNMGLPSGRCSVDGISIDCAWAMEMLDNGSAVQCPNNDCGAHVQTVTQRDQNGRVVGSSSYLVTYGQAGWDGSLDGTYRVNSAYASQFNVGTAAGAAAFANFIATGPSLYGNSFYSELVNRVTVTGTASSLSPQTQGPQFPRGTNQQYTQPVKAAFDAAVKRLKDNKNCAELFNLAFYAVTDDPIEIAEWELSGRPSIGLETLEATTYRILPMGAPTVNSNTRTVSVTGAATVSPTDVWINSEGPFFDYHPNVPGAGSTLLDFGTGLDQTQFSALLLLHELGHQVGIFQPDASNSELNRQQTELVIRNCFPEVSRP